MQPIDWSAIAAQRGPISQDQRTLSEMQALAGESERRLEEAGYIEMAQRDEQHDIQEAHRRGLTVGQWRDKVDAAIAYAESPEYAQAVWEQQGYEYASDWQAIEHGAAAEGDDPPPVAAVREDAVLDEPQAAVDYSGPGGDFDLQSASAFETQYPETRDFADLTGEDWAYLAEKYPERAFNEKLSRYNLFAVCPIHFVRPLAGYMATPWWPSRRLFHPDLHCSFRLT